MGVPSKKERVGEVAQSAVESFQRMALGFIPGGHVLEEFLNFRSNLKQKRILDFSERLRVALQEIAGVNNIERAFTTEEFVDVFDLVIKRVQNTNSEFKLERFKNILIKQIVEPIDLFTTLRYAEMLNDMEDIHIKILDELKTYSGIPFISDFAHLLTANYEVKHLHTNATVDIEIAGNTMQLEKSEIDFYGNQLVSLGLILKRTEAKSSKATMRKRISTSEYYIISATGERFLEFIKEN